MTLITTSERQMIANLADNGIDTAGFMVLASEDWSLRRTCSKERLQCLRVLSDTNCSSQAETHSPVVQSQYCEQSTHLSEKACGAGQSRRQWVPQISVSFISRLNTFLMSQVPENLRRHFNTLCDQSVLEPSLTVNFHVPKGDSSQWRTVRNSQFSKPLSDDVSLALFRRISERVPDGDVRTMECWPLCVLRPKRRVIATWTCSTWIKIQRRMSRKRHQKESVTVIKKVLLL